MQFYAHLKKLSMYFFLGRQSMGQERSAQHLKVIQTVVWIPNPQDCVNFLQIWTAHNIRQGVFEGCQKILRQG